jgi:catechol 2,3-dioxygenase-like lactoylglutathione lyase family enzyme
MIDHVSVRVMDISRSVAFYKAALAPLGYDVLMEFPGTAGLGTPGKPDVWLMQTDKPLNPTHLALSSERELVDAFHAAAVAAGGTDNGPPGVRADYHPNYYAAFILDPEGNNIEVVCHADPNARPVSSRPAARKAAARRPAARKAVAKPKKKAPAKTAKIAARKPAAKAKPARGKKKTRR